MIMSTANVPEESVATEAGATELEMAATVEAILFGADKPLPPAKISEIGELGGVRPIRKAVSLLNGRSTATFSPACTPAGPSLA